MSVKQKILQGAQQREELYVPELERDDFDGMVQVRPLTAGEQADVEKAAVAGQVVHTDMAAAAASGDPQQAPRTQQIDVAASQDGQRRSQHLTCAYGLSVDERWTAKEVAQLPPPAVRRIYNEVKRITGMDDLAAEARRFRTDGRGAAGGGAAHDGGAAGADAGAADTAADGIP